MDGAQEKRQVLPGLYFLSAGVFIAIFWGLFLLERFTSLRLVGASGIAHDKPLPIFVPLIGTPVALLVAFFLWRRAVGIMANGVPMKAMVRSVGAEVQSMRHVVLAYEFEGKSYEKKTSMVGVIAEKLSEGDSVDVVVDKRNPKRVVVS